MSAGGTKKRGKTVGAECDCPIEFLLKTPFKALKLEDKLNYLKLGRPKVDLTLMQASERQAKGKKVCIRHFRMELYEAVPWLCGCRRKNKLFCWPCLLFSREETVWNTVGYDDLNNLSMTAKLHRNSSHHIISLKEIKKFWKVFEKNLSGDKYVTQAEKKDSELHNLKAEKERKIFKRFVRVVSVLAKLGFPFSDFDLRKLLSGDNPHMEVFKLIAHYDADIKSLLIEKKSSFNFELKRVAMSMCNSILSEIKREISETKFVMLILDRVIDCDSKPSLATSLRYVKKNGGLVERFLHFTEWSQLAHAAAVKEHIVQVLTDFNCSSKLVAYSYDGAVLQLGEQPALKESLRKHSRALFIHYYGHGLVYIFKQTLSALSPVNVFFAALASFENLFSKPKLSEALRSEIKKYSLKPDVSLTWHDSSKLAEFVLNHLNSISVVLKTIVQNQGQYCAETLCSASNLLVLIGDLDFNFLLHTFSPIFSRCGILSQVLHTKMNDPAFCGNQIYNFEAFLEGRKKNFDSVWLNLSKRMSSPAYCARFNNMLNLQNDKVIISYRAFYGKILGILIRLVRERFGDVKNQFFLCLLDQTMFKKYHFQFPPSCMSSLADNFLSMLKLDHLKNELMAIYSDPEFRSVFDLHGYLKYQELDDIFPETYKLNELMLTLPLATKSTSISGRIRTFVKSGLVLNPHALLCIERELLSELVELDSFLDKVTNEFAEQANRKDLIFKVSTKTANQTPSVPVGLDPNLFASAYRPSTSAPQPSMVMDVDPITPDISVPSSVEGPSNRIEPDSSMDDNLTVTMTCEKFPVGEDYTQFADVKIKQEPEDPSDILSATVERELNSFSQDPPSASHKGGSLFQSPVLIKEEIVSSEEDL